MTSLLPRSDNTKGRIDGKVWDMIFIDTKTKKAKKKATVAAEPVDLVTAQNLDIRTWSSGDHKLLVSKGDRVNILIGDTQLVTISKPLLRATSTIAKDILKDGTIPRTSLFISRRTLFLIRRSRRPLESASMNSERRRGSRSAVSSRTRLESTTRHG
ncbi:hypothetical protein IG631_20353 [Alternaria alternata]|nr:hypothetical protein IG631_20353 [Alternaria alternata]